MADPQQRHRVVRSGTPARAGALRTASGLLGFVFGADMHPRIRLCRDEGEPLPAQPRDRTVHAFHDRGRRRLCDPRCRGVRRVGLCPYAHGRPVRMRRGRPCRTGKQPHDGLDVGERAEIRPDFRQTPHRLHGTLLHAGDPVYEGFAERRGLRERRFELLPDGRRREQDRHRFGILETEHGFGHVPCELQLQQQIPADGDGPRRLVLGLRRKPQVGLLPLGCRRMASRRGEFHQGQRFVGRHAENPLLLRRQR